MSHISKIDFDSIDKALGLKSNKGVIYEILESGELTFSIEPWNKGKKGVQQSTRKGSNREDLSPKMRKQIADKVRAYNLGKKHTKETKEKIRQLKLGKKRPDLIGNSFASNRDNSKYRTEAFRQKMREIAKRRWANA